MAQNLWAVNMLRFGLTSEEIRVKEDFLREVLRRKLFGNSESSWMKFEAWSTQKGLKMGPAKLPLNGEFSDTILNRLNRFGIFMDIPFSDKPTSFETSSKLIESDRLPQ